MPTRTISRAFFKPVCTTSFSLLIIALVTVSLKASARAWLATVGGALEVPALREASARPAPALSLPSQERVEAEIITVRPTGFEPAEFTRPEGQFFISVENQSGLDEVNLRLGVENGGRLYDVRKSRKQDWSDLMELRPGSYLLTEADHPDWVCRITITAR